jgi:3-hydroxybutyryl-CoA dehydrogenase
MQLTSLPAPTSSELVLGIVGCGVMGRGIAQIAALAGTQVKLFDAGAGAAAQARSTLADTFSMLVNKGRLSPERAQYASQGKRALLTAET